MLHENFCNLNVIINIFNCLFIAYIDKFKLFIKGFEPDVTEKEIKALSADIQDVQPCKLYAKQRNKKGFDYSSQSTTFINTRI